jgi:hypothetical protein
MSGPIARRGFRYQDLYLLRRVLPQLRQVFRRVWRAGGHEFLAALDADSLIFGIEARPRGSEEGAAPWDVTIADDRESEIIEAKSGAFPRSERQVLWHRLRRSVAASRGETFTPVLVIDPDKEEAEKWVQLTAAAASRPAAIPLAEPRVVHTCADLLEEALWHLCEPGNSSTPSLSRKDALQLLGRFQVHRFRASDLVAEVEADFTELFPDQAADDLAGMLRDWLDRHATDPEAQQRHIGLGDLLRQIARARESARLHPGTWQRWQNSREEWRAVVREKTNRRLGKTGAAIAIEDAQPELVGILDTSIATLLLGGGGFGKTTLLVGMEEALSPGGECWLVPAATLAIAEIDDLADAIRFRVALAEAGEVINLLVDGLDEIDSAACRQRWGQVLARLATLSCVRIAATIRDSDWSRADDLRLHLVGWSIRTLADWPETLVRRLLAPTQFSAASPTLISLLRTPILLDLFWRTYLDDGGATALALPLSRHELLATFWHERLGRGSRRHTALIDRPLCFAPIFAAAAGELAAFCGDGLDPAALGALAGEGVIVEVGRLHPRWQFRHPLLRDFALGQWCLMARYPADVVSRWSSIASGIAREGALRAVLEALAAAESHVDFPEVSIASLAEAFSTKNAGARAAFIRALGWVKGVPSADPCQWPPAIQVTLPADFAAEFITAAHHEKNRSWAPLIAQWPVEAGWFDGAAVRSVLNYLTLFVQERKRPCGDDTVRQDGQQLATAIRQWSEHSRLRVAFEEDHRWQKKHAIDLICVLLPNLETLAWLEREVPHFTWGTRSAALEALPHLAHAAPARTAGIYRAAVRLHYSDEGWRLDDSIWQQDLSYDALEQSLTGSFARGRSLVTVFPDAFLSVALEMAEALHHLEEERRQNDNAESGFGEALRAYFGGDPSAEEEPPLDPRGDLIDDVSDHQFRHRESLCEEAVKACAEQTAETKPELFARQVAPILRQSRLASAHEALLAAGAKAPPSAEVQRVLAQVVLDGRLYHVQGLLMPLAAALGVAAGELSEDERGAVLAQIESTRTSPRYYGRERARRTLLAALPSEMLNDEQRAIAENHRDEERRREERERPVDTDWVEVPPRDRGEFQERWLGEWPEDWDHEELRELYSLNIALIDGCKTPDELDSAAARLQTAALKFLPRWKSDRALLAPNDRVWVWQFLRQMIEKPRASIPNYAASPAVLHGCADLAIAFLEDRRGSWEPSRSEGDVEAGWSAAADGALALANEVLVHRNLPDVDLLYGRFDVVVSELWRGAEPPAQAKIFHSVTFLKHWRREDGALRALTLGPLWIEPRGARPIMAALCLIPHLNPQERNSALRQILARGDLPDAGELGTSIGGLLGEYAMVADEEGKRSELVQLVEEVTENPRAFVLLQNEDTLRHFLDRFCFGMKQQAIKRLERTELASDFARWCIAAWRHMRTLSPQHHHDSTSVALFAWCPVVERREPRQPPEQRVLWWRALRPLGALIVSDGRSRDIARLFHHMDRGELLDLITPVELFPMMITVLDRLEDEIARGAVTLNFFGESDAGARGWREALQLSAEAIEKLWNEGRLHEPREAEAAHALLVRLAGKPFHSDKAKAVLHQALIGS